MLHLVCGCWKAEILPEDGANIIRLQEGETDVLAPQRASNTDPFLVGSPLLFPANRTAGGSFRFEEKRYQLPVNEAKSGAHLHGLLHNEPFSVLEKTMSSARLFYENREKIYPFPFQLEVCYLLTQWGLSSSYRLKNTGSRAMPYIFGLHTTFCEPESFSVPLALCQQRDEKTALPTGSYAPLSQREQSYCTGAASRNNVISGYYKAAGNTARIGDYVYHVTGFDHWVLYNAQGKAGILCVEPQKGGVNGLNLPDPPVLAPGESAVFETVLSRPE